MTRLVLPRTYGDDAAGKSTPLELLELCKQELTLALEPLRLRPARPSRLIAKALLHDFESKPVDLHWKGQARAANVFYALCR